MWTTGAVRGLSMRLDEFARRSGDGAHGIAGGRGEVQGGCRAFEGLEGTAGHPGPHRQGTAALVLAPVRLSHDWPDFGSEQLDAAEHPFVWESSHTHV